MQIANLDDLEPFTTLDGSTIRELAGPAYSDEVTVMTEASAEA